MLTVANPKVTLADVIKDECAMKMPFTERTLMHEYSRGIRRARRVWRELKRVLSAVGIVTSWEPVENVVGAEIGAMPFEEARQLLAQRHGEFADSIVAKFIELLSNNRFRVGRIEWLSRKSCRFSFFDDGSESRTLMTIRRERLMFSHDLVNAKRVRLPADSIVIPAKAKAIIAAMPAWLQRWSYIAVGDRIVRRSEIVETTESPTALANFVDAAKRDIEEIAAVIGTAAGIAAAVVGGIAAHASAVSTAVVRDPALVIGDFTLFGWED